MFHDGAISLCLFCWGKKNIYRCWFSSIQGQKRNLNDHILSFDLLLLLFFF